MTNSNDIKKSYNCSFTNQILLVARNRQKTINFFILNKYDMNLMEKNGLDLSFSLSWLSCRKCCSTFTRADSKQINRRNNFAFKPLITIHQHSEGYESIFDHLLLISSHHKNMQEVLSVQNLTCFCQDGRDSLSVLIDTTQIPYEDVQHEIIFVILEMNAR